MTAVKTQIGAHDRATDVPFDPPSDLPATNVWDAISYLWTSLKAFAMSAASPQYLVAASDPTLANERVATSTATVAWDFSTPAQASANVPDNAITNAKIRDAAALSVIGRAANSSGDPADIAAASDDVLLRRVASALGFGPLTAGMVPNSLITTIMLLDGLVTFAKLNSAVYDTDGTLAGNSDTKFATQKAVKTYVDALATAVSGGLIFKGSFDASAGSFPGGGTAKIGYFYKVSVAGTVGGQPFDVGDDIYAIVNNASTSVYAANWLIVQGVLSSAEIIAALSNASIAYAKIQNVSATARVLGRKSAGAGVIEELVIGSDIQAFDAATLKSNATANLLTGFQITTTGTGNISSGTITPDPAVRGLYDYSNNGAHTLAPSTNKGTVIVDITNTATAGAITTSGFTKVTGDAFTTTNGNKFRCFISIGAAGSHLAVLALQ